MLFLRNPLVMSIAGIVGAVFIYNAENYWRTVPFAFVILVLIIGLLLVLTKKVAFSFYSGFMIIGLVTVISFVKFKLKGFSLHFYDLVFSGGDPEALLFLWGSYTRLVTIVLALAVCFTIASIILFRIDKKIDIGRKPMAIFLALPVIMLPISYPAEAMQERYSYYLQGRHTSAFFVSLLDISNLFSQGKLEKRLSAIPSQVPFSAEAKCGTKRPDVFVVLSETQSNPDDFIQSENIKDLRQHLAAANGPLQPLNVETFGGGTWISNLSWLTGLSTTDFGWRSPYLTIELEGKVRGALPEVFAKCGYHPMLLTPFEFSFVNEGPFLKSIGFETIHDKVAIGAPHYHLRDRFYFDAAERIIAEHRKNDGRPLFFVIQTMFPHSPYEERLASDIHMKGEPFRTDPQIAEYLRRMAIARKDLGDFFTKRREEAGEKGVVLVDFGDHQSFVTKKLIDRIAGPDALSKAGSLAYRTFYTMQHVGPWGTRIFADKEPLDIGLLGARMLSFAKLPSSELWDDLIRLDKACGGKLYGCANRKMFDLHLSRRMDSGLLSLANR